MIIDAWHTPGPCRHAGVSACQIRRWQNGQAAATSATINTASLEKGQLKLLDERGIDVMLFSPGLRMATLRRALISVMDRGDNELIPRCARLLYPNDRRRRSLPSLRGGFPQCVDELERCINVSD